MLVLKLCRYYSVAELHIGFPFTIIILENESSLYTSLYFRGKIWYCEELYKNFGMILEMVWSGNRILLYDTKTSWYA